MTRAGGTIGFKGGGRGRALEFPDGRSAEIAPTGRARIRANFVTRRFEGSIDGTSFEAFAVGGGGATFADLAALGAYDVSGVGDGAVVAVASLRDMFEYDATSTIAADGITVVAAVGGTGRWLRRLLPSLVWALRDTWYIDASFGDDENDGATSGSALASYRELGRRLGDLETPQRVTVHLLTDLAEDRYRFRGRHEGGLWLVGQEGVVASGQVASSTALDTTTTPVTLGELVAVALDFTGLEGQKVVLTSGPNAGAAAFILRVGPGGAGTSTVRVGEWFSMTLGPVAGPGVGDTFDVVSQTGIDGEIEIDTNDRGSGTYVAFQNVAIVGDAPFVQLRGWTVFLQSRLRSTDDDHISITSGGAFEMYGCLAWSYRIGVERAALAILYSTALLDSDVVVESGYLECNYNNACQFVAGGESADRAAVTFDPGGRLAIVVASARGGGIGALDLSAAGASLLSVGPGAVVDAGPGRLWTAGQGAGTWGVHVAAGGSIVWPEGKIAGAVFDLDSGGAGEQIDLGGTTTDAATLGAAGAVNAANNAMAVPARS